MTKVHSLSPLDSNPNGVRRYDLKGYERGLRVTKEGCNRIAHALEVTGPVHVIVQHLVPAFRMVLNRHPKTRALMSNNPDEPMTSYIQPPFANDAEVESLVMFDGLRRRRTTTNRHEPKSMEYNQPNIKFDMLLIQASLLLNNHTKSTLLCSIVAIDTEAIRQRRE